MDFFHSLLQSEAHRAHWYLFGGLLLAGMNIPLSADVLILCAALLASTIVPENVLKLYFGALFGCYFSAMIAFWLGRIVGTKLTKISFFAKILRPERLVKIRSFYESHGLLTLIFGRFIPFGIRNCIFMSTGMCKLSFRKFVLRDAIACSIWCTLCFFLYYSIGANYQVLMDYIKKANLVIFLGFSVTVIGFIWYKRKKNARSQKTDNPL